ncbi:MAG: dicarboxylate/amino acid:cation symporter [Gammaproteobacteria bacterium]|nr:dicarboxylate/amino acid:cation symporter [Gammaproteobacteria bacterium]NND61292.1 dicarboxylate/amino acid:cation symporter [Gammaproteobacteria bacterium]
MPWYRKLHWQILAGLVLGLVYGIVAAIAGWVEFTDDWISPWGSVFINLLTLIAVPLVLASLITGVSSLADTRKLSRIGGRTIGIYLGTTLVALVIGLVLVNVVQPGRSVPEEMRERLSAIYQDDASARAGMAEDARERGPLQPIVDMIPSNIFASVSNNRSMLQVVFFALFAGVALLMIPREKAEPLIGFFDSLSELVIKMVELIMRIAPFGVFCLLASTITDLAGDDPSQIVELLRALGLYSAVVIAGLAAHMLITYATLISVFTPRRLGEFFSRITPAQLVAFSTSSSGATLPVSMKVAEKNLGVSEEVSSFVLPLGATINMDGTALYQAVAAVFIAQTLGMDLTMGQQITIVLTAMLASIGTAAVPSAGIVMLVIILESINVPAAGIALILGVDRILDMCRTVTNVTGDLTVSTVVATAENQLDALPALESGY